MITKKPVTFVEDYAGHDVRYATDATKIVDETFSTGIKKTI